MTLWSASVSKICSTLIVLTSGKEGLLWRLKSVTHCVHIEVMHCTSLCVYHHMPGLHILIDVISNSLKGGICRCASVGSLTTTVRWRCSEGGGSNTMWPCYPNDILPLCFKESELKKLEPMSLGTAPITAMLQHVMLIIECIMTLLLLVLYKQGSSYELRLQVLTYSDAIRSSTLCSAHITANSQQLCFKTL